MKTVGQVLVVIPNLLLNLVHFQHCYANSLRMNSRVSNPNYNRNIMNRRTGKSLFPSISLNMKPHREKFQI
jgi:hypothetical protein